MKVTIELSDNREGTMAPFWMIIDPKQMMKPDDAEVAMSMVFGPWFSREDAEDHLKTCHYRYSKRAVVWCMSGHTSMQWRNAVRDAQKGNDAFSQMLKVLEEVKECSYYWSEYDVPLGLHERIDNALKAARGEK